MVYLNRIYTKSGDDGLTSLGDGSRVAKTHPRIAAYGTVDELNAVLGVVRTMALPGEIAECLAGVQNDLFDVGADLCVPESDKPPEYPPLRISSGQVTALETWIDRLNEPLEPLTSFVLPGGTPASAYLDLARTVCRRAELGVRSLAEVEPVSPEVGIYLNRLSDLLFVMGRTCNHVDGESREVLWVPGANR